MSSRKHLTMATLRRDGSPRISGTEVQFAGEHLEIGSMPRAVKARDLLRDPRVAIHGPTHDPAKSGRWRGEARSRAERWRWRRTVTVTAFESTFARQSSHVSVAKVS